MNPAQSMTHISEYRVLILILNKDIKMFQLVLPILLVTRHTEALSKECNIQKDGGNTKLIVEVHLREKCYFVFTSKDKSHQCCYDGPNNFCKSSPLYKGGNNSKCLKEDEYALKINPTTCVLSIASNSETASGLYKSYNAEDEEIQECDVQEDQEVGGSSAGVDVAVAVAVAVVVFTFIAVAAFMLSVFFYR